MGGGGGAGGHNSQLPPQLWELCPALLLLLLLTTAVSKVATREPPPPGTGSGLEKRDGPFLVCENAGSKSCVRRGGSSVLEVASGAMKTPEMGRGDEEGVEMTVGDSRNLVFWYVILEVVW